MQLAHRLDRVSEPQTIKMAKLGRELRAKGINIIDFSLGEPDFGTPEYICEAAIAAIKEGYSKYPPVAGFPELREAICTKLKRDNNLNYTPDEVIVSTGAKQSLANAILCLVNPGDEVIIPTPYWVTYSGLVQLAEGIPVFVQCGIDTQFKLSPQQLEDNLSHNTRLFIFSSPCNPSGSVYTRDELRALADVFVRYPHVAIISDEIYEYINYAGHHESIGQFADLHHRVLVVNGLSKGFAMTGWRLGYMAGPADVVQACEKLQGQFTSGANSITQRAAIAAMLGDLTNTREMTAAFRQRRNFVIGALKQMPGVRVLQPDGAFYAFPDISAFFGRGHGDTVIHTDEDLSMYLLHKAHVSTVNGAAFGNDQCIRISFATSMDKLREGMSRMSEALANLKG